MGLEDNLDVCARRIKLLKAQGMVTAFEEGRRDALRESLQLLRSLENEFNAKPKATNEEEDYQW